MKLALSIREEKEERRVAHEIRDTLAQNKDSHEVYAEWMKKNEIIRNSYHTFSSSPLVLDSSFCMCCCLRFNVIKFNLYITLQLGDNVVLHGGGFPVCATQVKVCVVLTLLSYDRVFQCGGGTFSRGKQT